MKLHEMKNVVGAVHRKKRVGCGEGSGHGKTSGRGGKGQSARSGSSIRPGFEGGQMPLQRRIPKGGFKNINRMEYAAINLDVLQALADELKVNKIDREVLISKHLISKSDLFKVLGRGEIKAGLEVHAHKFSDSAQSAIETAGGSVHVINR
jgi:large subunit ribosomal protein L15